MEQLLHICRVFLSFTQSAKVLPMKQVDWQCGECYWITQDYRVFKMPVGRARTVAVYSSAVKTLTLVDTALAR